MIGDAVHLVRHRGVRVAGDDRRPPARAGRPRATAQISASGVAGRQVVRAIERARSVPPAWAATMTTSAPARAARSRASRMVSASGATDRPADVRRRSSRSGRRSVITPTMPTLTPATSTSVVGRTLGHAGRRAAGGVDQVGGEEREARLRRPRLERAARIVGRRPRRRRRADRAEVELVIADRGGACSRARCRRATTAAPSPKFDSSVPWNMSPASISSTAPPSRARAARRFFDVAAEQREPAAAVPRARRRRADRWCRRSTP